jgi:deazaflavin-dependent oxidoreductase (nitroreductase family)
MASLRNSAIGRGIEKMAGSPRFAKVGPKVVPKVDRAVHKVTGGRVLMSAGMVPSLMLNVRGAKSGKLRQTPLATVPINDSWYIVGSNFGRESHPVWTVNLQANPDASISFKGQTYEVMASLLNEDEKRAVWPQLTKLWPNYDVYVERSHRDLRVFRLDRR